MPQIPPITDAYIDEIIKAPDAYNPSLNKTQGVKLRELIKLMRDKLEQSGNGGSGSDLQSVLDQGNAADKSIVITGNSRPVSGRGIVIDANYNTPYNRATIAYNFDGVVNNILEADFGDGLIPSVAVSAEDASSGKRTYMRLASTEGDSEYGTAVSFHHVKSSGYSLARVSGGNGLYANEFITKQQLDIVKNSINPLISVTYNELVNLVNTGTLIPGQNYLLIDFVSTFNMYKVTYNNGEYSVSYTDEIYNGTIEPIIINAVKTNLLSSIAYSTIYSSHELIYTTDNLLGGVFASTKGTILTRVEKEFNNRANFDWVSLKYTNENNAIVPAIYFGDQYYNRAINCSIYVTDQYGLLKMIIIKSISGSVNVKMNQDSGSCIIGSLYDTDVRSSRLDAYNVNIENSKIKNLSLIYGDINNQQIYISNLNMMNNSANVNYNSNWALLQKAAQKNIIDVYSQAYIQYINEQGQFITQLLA